jgi:hypothetical protein
VLANKMCSLLKGGTESACCQVLRNKRWFDGRIGGSWVGMARRMARINIEA